jgi:anti-sigma regulatory factor (Ser/Thr protein kinase)
VSGGPELDAGATVPLALAVAARPESLPAVRRAVATWIEPVGIDGDSASAVLVVVSELAANSVEACEPSDQISVRLAASGDRLSVEVSNPSRRTTPVLIPAMADPLAPRGRGLAIVSSLAEEVTLAEIGGQTVARVTLRLAGGG